MSVSLRKTLTVSFSLLSILGYGIFVFAAAPTGGYLPAQTLNPNCAPGDTDCFVAPYFINTTGNTAWLGYDQVQGVLLRTTPYSSVLTQVTVQRMQTTLTSLDKTQDKTQ